MTPQLDSPAARLLDDLQQRGYSVHAEGQDLYVLPAGRLTEADRIAIKDHKAELLSLLNAAGEAMDVTWTVRVQAGQVPPIIRLRRALKTLLRSFGIRSLTMIGDAPKPPAEKEGEPCN